MIYLEPNHQILIQTILKQAGVKFYAFGSRVTGKHKPFSDLDLCYKDPISLKILTKLNNDFVDSDLPFSIDLVDYSKASDEFKSIIDAQSVEFPLT